MCDRPGHQGGLSVGAQCPRSGSPRSEEDTKVPDRKWLGQMTEEVWYSHQSEGEIIRRSEVQKYRTPTLYSVPHNREPRGQKAKCQCL